MVRAKFRVVETKKYTEDSGAVSLQAVTGGSTENESFWKYTPSGNIEMHIDNPAALEKFKPQQEFYVDFTPVDTEGR